MDNELEVRHLSLSYGATQAFSSVSASFPKNKISAIIGPSGCGKSSFISALNQLYRFEKSAHLTGDIYWQGQSIFRDKPYLANYLKSVGTIFQQACPFPTSIQENIFIPLEEHFSLSKSEKFERLEELLKQVSLWDELKDRLNRNARQLSGGQLQRLCLARALSLKPDILFLDEPCSALDPIATAEIEALLSDLKRQVTIIMVTHNMAQARRIADKVILFWHKPGEGGYIESEGDCELIFQAPPSQITAGYIQGLSG